MDAWDRQPYDSDESFMWFQAYRDATPPRQLSRIRLKDRAAMKPTLQTLLEWYNAGHWRERAATWDVHLDSLRQTEYEAIVGQTARDKATREEAILNDACELVEREIDKLLQTSLSSESECLKPGELNKLLENVLKLRRLARGDTTENVGSAYDLSGMSLADLKSLRELQEKARKKH